METEPRETGPEETGTTSAAGLLAGAAGIAAAVLLGISPWSGGGDARTHALLALAAAGLAALVARSWQPWHVPPERLARVLLVGALLLVAVAQLLQGAGALGSGWLEDAGVALGRLAYPLVLVAAVAAVAVAFAKSQRKPL
jgi:hypothetical protein